MEPSERLGLLRLLSGKPRWIDILKEALALETQKAAEYQGRDYPYLGWQWFDVHAHHQQLLKLVEARLLDVTLKTNRATHFKVRNPELVAEALDALAEEVYEETEEESIPDDLFSNIVGHDKVKELTRLAIASEKPVHLLLSGPPASAKTLFLLELRRLPRAYYAIASSLSEPGVTDVLFNWQPKYLLLDEIDRLRSDHIGQLNSLMATGILSETKARKTRSVQLDTKVFAAGIRIHLLPQDLLSRFIRLHFHPYAESEFTEVAVTVIEREGVERSVGHQIAHAIWLTHGIQSDVRQCVSIARLVGDNTDKLQEVLAAVRKYTEER